MYHVAVVCRQPDIFEKIADCVHSYFSNLIVLHGPYVDVESLEGYRACVEINTERALIGEKTNGTVRISTLSPFHDDSHQFVTLAGDSPPLRILIALLALLEQFEVRDSRENIAVDITHLTAREMEVLRLVSGGYSNREIAAFLHITERTVKYHVSRILEKLNVSGRTEAVMEAARRGLLML